MSKRHFLLTTLVTVAILGSLSLAVTMWLREKLTRALDVPHAIYATGQLVDVCHTHRQRHRRWPPPGGYAARDVVFVRSYDDQGTRVDVFHFGRGQYAHVRFEQNSLLVLPVHGDPPPARPTAMTTTTLPTPTTR